MPKLSVYMVKASFIYMVFGFLFGAMILLQKGLPYYPAVWNLLTLHIDIMIFGWTLQFAMGLSFFALPRFSPPMDRYGAEHLGWMSFATFNGGLCLLLLSRWFHVDIFSLIASGFVMAGVAFYVLMMWPRVKPLMVQSSNS
ncbi:hypothetical protein MASR2M15_18230 [Anaerolineales bacterium]|jgi:hypothetical protein